MNRPTLLIALALFLITPLSSARTLEYEGWLFGEQADEALAYAEEHDIPVVIVKTFRTTSCPKCVGATQSMVSAKANRELIRIMYFVGDGSKGLNTEKTTQLYRKVAGQVKDPSNLAPDMYYSTAEGTALGFVPYEKANDSRAEAGKILQIAEWLSSVPVEVSKADRQAERGRYQKAVEDIGRIIERAAKLSHMIQVQVGMADADAKMPEQPVTDFFPGLLETKTGEYNAMAEKALDKARALVEAGKLTEARRALLPLTRGPESFKTTAAAKQLLDQVVEQMRDKG